MVVDVHVDIPTGIDVDVAIDIATLLTLPTLLLRTPLVRACAPLLLI